MKLNKLIVGMSGLVLMGTLAACGNQEAQSQDSSSATSVSKSAAQADKAAKLDMDASAVSGEAVSKKTASSAESKKDSDDKDSELASDANELTEEQEAALTGWYAANDKNINVDGAPKGKVGVTKASRSKMGTPELPTGGDKYYQMYWQDGYGDKSITYTTKGNDVYIFDNDGTWKKTTMQNILDKAKSEGATGEISTVAGNTEVTNN